MIWCPDCDGEGYYMTKVSFQYINVNEKGQNSVEDFQSDMPIRMAGAFSEFRTGTRGIFVLWHLNCAELPDMPLVYEGAYVITSHKSPWSWRR